MLHLAIEHLSGLGQLMPFHLMAVDHTDYKIEFDDLVDAFFIDSHELDELENEVIERFNKHWLTIPEKTRKLLAVCSIFDLRDPISSQLANKETKGYDAFVEDIDFIRHSCKTVNINAAIRYYRKAYPEYRKNKYVEKRMLREGRVVLQRSLRTLEALYGKGMVDVITSGKTLHIEGELAKYSISLNPRHLIRRSSSDYLNHNNLNIDVEDSNGKQKMCVYFHGLPIIDQVIALLTTLEYDEEKVLSTGNRFDIATPQDDRVMTVAEADRELALELIGDTFAFTPFVEGIELSPEKMNDVKLSQEDLDIIFDSPYSRHHLSKKLDTSTLSVYRVFNK